MDYAGAEALDRLILQACEQPFGPFAMVLMARRDDGQAGANRHGQDGSRSLFDEADDLFHLLNQLFIADQTGSHG